MIAAARQRELSCVAAKAAALIFGATEKGGRLYDADEAAYICACLLVNFAREGSGPDFAVSGPFMRVVARHIAEMKVAVARKDCELISMTEVNQ